MYLKNDRIIVTIKDVVFRSYKSGTGGQFILDPTAITGWDDGANIRRNTTARPVSSGDFSEPYNHSSRLIALTGTAIAPSRQELQVLRDKLTGIIGENEYTIISVETSAGTRYSTVGLEGSVSWVQHLDKVASFKIDLYAPDPNLYGVTKRQQAGSYIVSGGLDFRLSFPLDYHLNQDNAYTVIANNGNATAYPLFEAIGDFYSGFTVQDSLGGNTVTYTGMVTRSAPVILDMAKGTATQSGVDKTVLVTRREWFGIPPHQTISPVFTPLGGNGSASGLGWCDIIYRDTWI